MALDRKSQLCMVRLFEDDVKTVREHGFNISSILRRLLSEEAQKIKNRTILESRNQGNEKPM